MIREIATIGNKKINPPIVGMFDFLTMWPGGPSSLIVCLVPVFLSSFIRGLPRSSEVTSETKNKSKLLITFIIAVQAKMPVTEE